MRRWFRSCQMVALLLLLNACGAAVPQADTVPVAPVTPVMPVVPSPLPMPTLPVARTITVAYPDALERTYRAWVRGFQQTYPQITVQLVALTDAAQGVRDTETQPTARAAAVLARADVAPAEIVSSALLRQGLLADLVPLMRSGPPLDRDAWYPGMLQRARVGDAIYVVPRTLTVPLLAVNTTRVPNEEPTPAWRWADVLHTAERATSGTAGGLRDTSGGLLPLLGVMEQQQLAVGDAAQFAVNTPAMQTALTRLRDDVRRGVVVSAFDPAHAASSAAFWLDDGQAAGQAGTPPTTHTIVAPLLLGPNDAGIDGAVLRRGSAHPADAWRWMEYASRQTAPADALPGHLPARPALITRAWAQMDTEAQKAVLVALAQPESWTPWWKQADAGPLVNTLARVAQRVVADPAQDLPALLTQAQHELDTARQQRAAAMPAPLTPVAVAARTPTTPTTPTTVIRFGMLGNHVPNLAPLIAAFTAQHPDTRVTLLATEPLSTPTTVAQMAQQTDCFATDRVPEQPEDVAAVRDLLPVMRDDTTYPADDVLPALAARVAQHGRVVALPYAWNLPAVGYNPALVGTARAGLPSAAWTVDTFAARARALTHDRTYGYVPLDQARDLAFFLRRANVHLTTGTGAAARAHFTDPAVVSTVAAYRDLVRRSAPPTGANDPAPVTQLLGGHGALWFDLGGDLDVDAAPAGDITRAAPAAGSVPNAVAAPPLGGAPLRTDDLTARVLVMSATTRAYGACWGWMRFVSEQPAVFGDDVPARRSVATGPAWTTTTDLHTQQRAVALTPLLDQPLATGDAPTVPLDWLWSAIDQQRAQNTVSGLPAALAAAEQRTNDYLTCLDHGTERGVCLTAAPLGRTIAP